ncbi:MAG TPA: radical SAM protein [Candidatus Acidoferrales bacterium]|nr:radical SAM protein [Candidatus Acidoferrales bacterium]
MRVTLVTCGLEHLGIEALSAWVKQAGHEAVLVYESRPFSSGSGTDSPLLARLLEPRPEQTADRVVATQPDVVAFTSYSVTHRWAVDVARAVKQRCTAPIVFGGPHVSAAPDRAIAESSIDAVVEGEGEEALVDLMECAEDGRFGRTDIRNCTFRHDGAVVRNPVRPLLHDLDALPWADKSGFYATVPAFEHEFYVVSRRGCPFRCSFCEYSTFPRQYPGEKPVRRRSIEHLIAELAFWKARGKVRKVFFWDAIFTLDPKWMAEFASAYRSEIAIPFECYTHPQTMTRDMARWLAEAGCIMVRVGVQSVNSDTLAAVDRKGDREKVLQTLRSLANYDVPYSIDHIIGLPGEGAADQLEALRFYADVDPKRIVTHWMTYFPGTTALDHAREHGILDAADIDRILDGEVGPGYMFGGNKEYRDHDELQSLSGMFDLLPLLPRNIIQWLLEGQRYRHLRGAGLMRQLGTLALAIRGEPATREHVRHIMATTIDATRDALRRKLGFAPTRHPQASVEIPDRHALGRSVAPESTPSSSVALRAS